MPTISDADTWWTAPAGGTPMEGFTGASDYNDWFEIGPLAAGLPARVSILPDYFVPYASGIPVGGLLPETLLTTGNIQLYQLVTITGNFNEAVIDEGLFSYASEDAHGNQLVVPVADAVEVVDQILTDQFPGGILPYTFDQITANVPPSKTVVYNDPDNPDLSYTVTWENDFYLDVGLSGVFPSGPPDTAGRYLVTTGNPSGQRSANWGPWLDGWDLNTQQPVGSPIYPSSPDLNPQNLPAIIDVYESADQHAVETPAIASVSDPTFFQTTSEDILHGYASIALDSLRKLADATGHPDLGAAIDVVNASASADAVKNFLSDYVGKIWAHVADDITLAALASADPDPSAYDQQIADRERQDAQFFQGLQQEPQDQAISIVLDKAVPGGGTVWSVWKSLPFSGHQENSFTLAAQVPQLNIQGSDKSDVVYGGSGADVMQLGGGMDMALGFGGDDVISAGAGNDWLMGGAGNDTLDGGAGIDAAIFSGNRSAYTITRDGASITVSGTDGTDTLTHIEQAIFDDQVVILGQGPVSADFNNDLYSDILWQNTGGQAGIWTMNGLAQLGGSAVGGNPGPAWHVKGSGDFNGDGKADILWQNDSGQAAIWTMDGFTQLSGSAVGGNPGPTWHVIGSGDFNGDGKADILWQNENGQAAIWTMDGLTQLSGSAVGGNPGTTWHVVGSGDFNGDGKSDILWQNQDGQAAIWLMDGLTQLSGSAVGGNPGPTWHVIGSGDFNGDGKSDILWQNDSGQAAIWLMDGLTQLSGSAVGGNPGLTWHVKGAGDFNGDGKADILWQNDSGQAAIWTMDGLTQLTGSAVGGNPGTAWHVVSMTS